MAGNKGRYIPTNIKGIKSIEGFSEEDIRHFALMAPDLQNISEFTKTVADAPDFKSEQQILNFLDWLAPKRVIPSFTVVPRKSKCRKGIKKLKRFQKINSGDNQSWAGCSLSGQWQSVKGTWVIPGISAPSGPPGGNGCWNSSSWIGVGGAGGGDILQAGVEQSILANKQVYYKLWVEWFAPGVSTSIPYVGQHNIDNFQVSPGQSISCVVSYTNDGKGSFYIINNSNANQNLQFTIDPPQGAVVNQNSVEWILEAPDDYPPPTILPEFQKIIFTNAMGVGLGGEVGDPVAGDIWDICYEPTTGIEHVTSSSKNSKSVSVDYIL